MTIKLLLYASAFLSSGIGLSIMAESPSQQLFVRRFVIDETFPWIKAGQLIYYRIEGALAPHGAVAYYQVKGSSEILSLNGSLSALSEVVVLEGPTVDEQFLRKQVPQFLVFLTAQPRSRVLDHEYLVEVQASRSLEPTMKKSIGQLCRDPVLKLENTSWKLSFAVMNADGSASEWTVDGRTAPFSFSKVSLQTLKERGALKFSIDRP